MEIHYFNSINFFYYTKDNCTLADLADYVRVKVKELYYAAVENGLEVTGSVYWVYYGMDGKPDTRFRLEIGIPVNDCLSKLSCFEYKKLEASRFITHRLYGDWSLLPETYGLIFSELKNKNLIATSECREVYIHIDFQNPENNITEVQVGVY
jgi:effector-binding domain-containing protein